MAKDDDVELEFQEDVQPEHPPDITSDDPDIIRPESSDEPEDDKEDVPEKVEDDKPEVKDKPKQKPRKPAKDRIREILSENHALQERLIEMDNHYRELENKLQYSNLAATQHFDDSVTLRLDKAKQLKKQAYESGDVDAMLEADTELSRAVHAQQQSSLWKAQNQVQEQSYAPQEQSYQAVQQERDFESRNWGAQNTWFFKGSHDYDPHLAADVETAASKFDDYLRSRGEADLIGTRQYFQEINKYVDGRRYDDDAPQQRRSLRMKPQGHVSPAGRSSGSLAPSGENFKLSKLDAQWADNIGMSHKEYAKFIAAEREAENNARRR